MDVFSILFLCLVSIIIGIILTLVAQYYILAKIVQRKPLIASVHKPIFEKYCLPEGIKNQLDIINEDDTKKENSSLAVSLLLQFLFYELRNKNTIKQWFYEKLSLEFDDLLTKTTTGKFFEAVNIVDLSLGSQFPNIKDIKIDDVEMDSTNGNIETLTLSLDIDYSGNFQLSVDTKMKFGKTAFLSIKVKQIKGLARLQFTRKPYTHWSLCFYSDPYINLGVDSHFQSRQLHSNITSLIINQIKKAIKRKHTLPNYKIRYKPFFKKIDTGQIISSDDYEIATIYGQLEVTFVELTRIYVDDSITSVFCTFSVDTLPWIKFLQNETDETEITSIIIDLVVYKERHQNLGVVFKHGPQQLQQTQLQESTTQKSVKSQQQQSSTVMEVTAETIVINSPAYKAGLKRGDLILAIEGKEINNVAQVAKLFKSVNKTAFNVRIQRQVTNYKLIKSNISTSSEVPVIVNSSIENAAPLVSSNNDTDVLDMNTFTIINDEDILEPIQQPQYLSRSFNESRTKGLNPDSKISKILSSSNENMSKIAHTIGNFSLRKRKISDDKNSSDSSNKSTPNISASNSPDRTSKLRGTEPLLIKIDNPLTEQPSMPTPVKSVGDTVVDESNLIRCYHTNLSSVSSIMTGSEDEQFLFDLRKDFKYLNVQVWGVKCEKNVPINVLCGYINIPLINILNECNNSAFGHYVNCYSFLPPDFATNRFSNLSSHSGFDSKSCYGDILLSFSWKSSEIVPPPTENSSLDCPSPTIEITDTNEKRKHDFIRTQFHQSTQCDFCLKKIWLKDAVQCRNCAICCHKKCIEKCQSGTTCPLIKDATDSTNNGNQKTNPFIVTSEPTESGDGNIDELSDASPTGAGLEYHRQSFSSLSTNEMTSSMKRVNSAHNLTIPELQSDGNQVSRSVPHSSQHTPNRKMSLVTNNPFTDCADLLNKLVENFEENEENMSIILGHIQHCIQNENIMDIAKESSKNLCKDVSQEQRATKISAMIANLKTSLDVQTTKHCELLQKLNDEPNENEKARTAFLIGEADSQIQALSILMLYFCSGLQDCAQSTDSTIDSLGSK
ncbi:PDZ domain-containing protein 8 [Chrysoperla carnea]|uniref:PDZ domain-containing protein 8 n=1 Tax=Chrysoperla carnea TaxID=189513 RepID=UPI001D069824|nr:PDZ domain-containing protein 8 [Chrysoperla carnea]